jgi:hypothetical protein
MKSPQRISNWVLAMSKAITISLILVAGMTLLAVILENFGTVPHSIVTRYITVLVFLFGIYLILKVVSIRLGL